MSSSAQPLDGDRRLRIIDITCDFHGWGAMCFAYVFNSWDAMPPVGEQMALPGSQTNPDLVAARFLLKPGRKYEQAVKAFEPYEGIKEENPEARAAGRELIAEGPRRGLSARR